MGIFDFMKKSPSDKLKAVDAPPIPNKSSFQSSEFPALKPDSKAMPDHSAPTGVSIESTIHGSKLSQISESVPSNSLSPSYQVPKPKQGFSLFGPPKEEPAMSDIKPIPPEPANRSDDIPLASQEFEQVDEWAPDEDQLKFEQEFVAPNLDFTMPLFIESSEYSQVLLNIKMSKRELRAAHDLVYVVHEIDMRRSKVGKQFQDNIESIQRHLMLMDKIIFKS